jgi:hypothetical protein
MATFKTWMGEPIEEVCFRNDTPGSPSHVPVRITFKSGLVLNEVISNLEAENLLWEGTKTCRPLTAQTNQLPEDSELRNSYPMADGLIDYFPNALAEVSRISYIGNQKHNPGEPMHWARSKSTDHRNKIARHLVDVGGFEETEVDGKPVKVRHSAYLAWRALANLQEELEREEGYPMSRGSRAG